jgi:hypothetical protein
LSGAVFLNRVTDQCTSGSSNRGAHRGAAWTATGESADNCSGARAGCSSLTGWRITRTQTERTE